MFGDPVAQMEPAGSAGGLPATYELALPAGRAFDAVVIQEDIRHGERCRSYELQLLRSGAWTSLGEGSCIGHKRIHRLEASQRGEGLRLLISEASAAPRISHLSVHATRP